VPKEGTIDLQGLENVDIKDIIKIDKNKWLAELELIKTHYNVFGDRLPSELRRQFAELEKRLNNA